MPSIFLLLGSNLGDSETYIEQARIKVSERVGDIKKSSALYRTTAWGKTDQPDFINQALEIISDISPEQLLVTVLSIEHDMGRTRKEKWEARVIDIDILFYEDRIINEPDLIIPHPFVHERRFALEPMMEINAQWIHPVFKRTIEQLYLVLKDTLSVKRLYN